jgi:hypothetical protein
MVVVGRARNSGMRMTCFRLRGIFRDTCKVLRSCKELMAAKVTPACLTLGFGLYRGFGTQERIIGD